MGGIREKEKKIEKSTHYTHPWNTAATKEKRNVARFLKLMTIYVESNTRPSRSRNSAFFFFSLGIFNAGKNLHGYNVSCAVHTRVKKRAFVSCKALKLKLNRIVVKKNK